METRISVTYGSFFYLGTKVGGIFYLGTKVDGVPCWYWDEKVDVGTCWIALLIFGILVSWHFVVFSVVKPRDRRYLYYI